MKTTESAVLTIRPMSGLSGDIMLSGLALMAGATNADLARLASALNLPVEIRINLVPRSVNNILGMGLEMDLPHEHEHRALSDILEIIAQSRLEPEAKILAASAFSQLAEVEGRMHGKAAAEVHFHEVGALDSIIDICLSCALFGQIKPKRLICGPLPLADGVIACAHGWLPSPAPAVLDMLPGVKVCGFQGEGETITPTGLILLKVFEAEFGTWPGMQVDKTALVYGGKVFPGAPNGVIWARGQESHACAE